MRKEFAIDRWLHDILDRYLDVIAMVLLAAMATAARIVLLPHTVESPDYTTYYLAWVEHFRELGFVQGMSSCPGDYYIPLMMMYAFCAMLPCEPWLPLGLISMAAEYVSAIYIYRILLQLGERNGTAASHTAGLNGADPSDRNVRRMAMYTAAGVLFIPIVMINGALWKQCDSIYAVFLIISIYHLLKDEYTRSFIFLGLSFSIKLQSVFFIPLFIVIYLLKRNSYTILEFLWIPAVYLFTGLPAVLCQHGLRATYFTYFTQTGETDSEGYGMVSYYPNIYNFGLDDYDKVLKLPAVLLTATVLGLICVYAVKHRQALTGNGSDEASGNRSRLLYLGIFMAWTCLQFLPGMHERYDYVVVILATVYYVAVRHERQWIAASMNFCAVCGYAMTIFHYEKLPILMTTVISIITYLCMAWDLRNELSK